MNFEAKKNWMICQGDSLDLAKQLPDCCLDAIVQDPPCGISFLQAKWDSDKGGRDAWIAWLASIMKEGFRALKPGGFAVVWAIPRTSHWTAMALEDAGFEVKNVISALKSTGFPKGLDIGKACDRMRDDDIYHVTAFIAQARDAAGKTNPEIDEHFNYHGMAGHWTSSKSQPAVPTWENWLKLKEFLGFDDSLDAEVQKLNVRKGKPGDAWYERPVVGWETDGVQGHVFSAAGAAPTYKSEFAVTGHVSEEAHAWDGWNTSLRPNSEHWLVCQKPLAARNYASNVIQYGVGGLNVKGCGVPRGDGEDFGWPSNVVIEHAAVPVLRLAANLPIDTDAQIRRFFDGYSGVSEMRSRKGCAAVSVEVGAKVLQPVVQGFGVCEGSHSVQGGEVLRPMWGDFSLSSRVGQGGTPEVLQQGVPGRELSTPQGRQEQTLGDKTYGRVEGEDVPDMLGEGETVGRSTPSVERGENTGEGGILPGYGLHSTAVGTGDRPEDGGDVPVCSRASDSHGCEAWPPSGSEGGCSSQEWGQAGQPGGEPGREGVGGSLQGTPDYRTEAGRPGGREQATSGGNPPLEVLVADVPHGWLGYFEPTGEIFGCDAGTCVEGCPALELDRQSGATVSRRADMAAESAKNLGGFLDWNSRESTERGHNDSGGASRYYNQFHYGPEDLPSFVYVPGASRAEKEAGCAEAGIEPRVLNRVNSGGLENDPRWSPRIVYNDHPTTKSVKLMRWLCRLVVPKGATILDMFAGSGTTGVAAALEGMNFIGFDMDERYCQIARARIAHWSGLAEEAAEGGVPVLSPRTASPAVPKAARPAPALTLGLFDEDEG